MKKEKVIASPMITRFMFWDIDLLIKTVQEYVEYLRLKVKKGNNGIYYCGSQEDDYDKCWDKTERFCKKKGWDLETFRELLGEYRVGSNCESCIANDFDLPAFLRKMTERREKED